MASPSELTLDYKPNTNNYPMMQKPLGDQNDQPTQKLEDFLSRLEEERLKIEAFKRELPLCMQLLNNAVETYKRQLELTYNNNNQGPKPPVLEEFIPITSTGPDKPATTASEKPNWMLSAQLWSPPSDPSPKPIDTNKNRNGGAFLPFSKEKANGTNNNNNNKGLASGSRVSPDLALASAKKEVEVEEKCTEASPATVAAGSGHRKARRCWSPDLHRRFVNALQMLGGSQVATPKQIRELMKVDGLTNDEVKSHLQKYRLHTRRPLHPPQPSHAAAPQLVVLGGIWVPPEYAAAATAGPGIYQAAPTAAHYPVSHHPVPHHPDFYPSQPPHHQRQLSRSGLTAAVPFAARLQSPESELRSSGDRSESIDDGDEGEEREVEEEDDEGDNDEEIMEEVKVEDKAIVVAVESNGNGGDVALKF